VKKRKEKKRREGAFIRSLILLPATGTVRSPQPGRKEGAPREEKGRAEKRKAQSVFSLIVALAAPFLLFLSVFLSLPPPHHNDQFVESSIDFFLPQDVVFPGLPSPSTSILLCHPSTWEEGTVDTTRRMKLPDELRSRSAEGGSISLRREWACCSWEGMGMDLKELRGESKTH